MNATPEKGRGTTGKGRPCAPSRRNRVPGSKGSVSHPSHADPKCVSVFPISHVTPCKRPVTSEYGFVLVSLRSVTIEQRSTTIATTSSTTASPDSQLRKPGGRGLTAWNLEVGGSGGNGWTATAYSGRRTEKSPAVAGRSRSLSVTCYTTPLSTPSGAVFSKKQVSTAEIGVRR